MIAHSEGPTIPLDPEIEQTLEQLRAYMQMHLKTSSEQLLCVVRKFYNRLLDAPVGRERTRLYTETRVALGAYRTGDCVDDFLQAVEGLCSNKLRPRRLPPCSN